MGTSTSQEFAVIGTRPIRHDGFDKVTGRALYGADIRFPGLLHGRVLRSPHAHARIRSINTASAQALPGVKAIVTARDLALGSMSDAESQETSSGFRYLSDNVLARDKVLYRGHAVAAVAAVSPHVAEQALNLIDIDYEVLPAAVNVLDAIKEDAPLLLDDLVTEELGTPSETRSNVAKHFRFEKGNVKKGFSEAELVVHRRFKTATVHQGYIETHNATALSSSDGTVTIWCSTQGAFNVRSTTAQLLNITESRIRVVPMEIGGGFGGKINVYLEPVAVLLSQKTGSPVKVLMTRGEVFEGTGPTPGTFMEIQMGMDRTGRITAAELDLYYEAGAYPGSPVSAGAQCALAPYNLENARVDGYDVVVNKPKTAAYRAPGATTSCLAVETVIDELCSGLNLDPLKVRFLNGVREGDRRVDGPAYRKIGYIETLEAVRDHPHWSAPLGGSNRGRGLATGFWFNGSGPSSCYITVNSDGTVSLVEGSTDIGGTRASVAMQAAEVLGIPAESVKPIVADTDSVGYTSVTGGSSVAFKTGWAAYKAAQDVIVQMTERIARIWETEVDKIGFSRGVFKSATDQSQMMTFKQLAGMLLKTGGPITGRANVDPGGVGPTFAAHIVDVQVDKETGKVDILRYTAVQDCGKAVHPSYVEGQIQGGVAQGIGWALNEEYAFNENGWMSNPTFLDYRMPTSLDLPMIDCVLVEVANPGHPFGVRGVGEVPIVPPPAAIANAIADAIGIRLTELPMSPGKVLEGIWGTTRNGRTA